MRRFALLGACLAAQATAFPQAEKNNSTTSASSIISQQSPQNAQAVSSSVVPSSSSSKSASSSVAISSTVVSSSRVSSGSSPSAPASVVSSSSISPAQSTVTRPANTTSKATTSLNLLSLTRSFSKDNNTRLITPTGLNASTPTSTLGPCTGCVIQATAPITSWYTPDPVGNPWASVVVTETILTEFTTYLDTIVTSVTTLSQTKTLIIPGGGQNGTTITHTTPQFKITPTDGVTLTVDAGPTYVIYNELRGALDRSIETVMSSQTMVGCVAFPTDLVNWQPRLPQQESAWNYFIETYSATSVQATATSGVKIPAAAIQYLQNNQAILSQFHGSNIATCSYLPLTNSLIAKPRPTGNVPVESKISAAPSSTVYATEPAATTAMPYPSAPSAAPLVPSTYLSTEYSSTSKHVSRNECLRCDDSATKKIDDQPPPTPPNNNPQPPYSANPPNNPTNPPDNQPPQTNPSPGQQITIGSSTYDVRPGPSQNPDTPSDQNTGRPNDQDPPQGGGVVIGSNTLTQGQSTNINGIPVVVPSDGGGSRIVVDGTTVPVYPVQTNPPVLTFGQNTVTANSQGQFVVGSQTLQPGGAPITVNGNTISLAPAGSIAIVNGVTQTLANAPTPPPVLTVGGKVLTATSYGGTTQLVLNGQTLAPGSALTVDGTTYSMPADGQGRTVVVNGQTSTLGSGQSVLTVGNMGITASVNGATTAFVFGPGQTLIPGGVITVSGTTFSMPVSASGSVIVINGVTTTLGKGPTTPAALTINGQTYGATVRDGTTEYVLGQGTTLRPGQAVTVSGTTYSLDPKGTALIINGQTSTLPKTPASNSASTTAASTTNPRDVGNFVWSGIGGKDNQSSSKGGAAHIRGGGLDMWVEGLIIGVAGWLMTL